MNNSKEGNHRNRLDIEQDIKMPIQNIRERGKRVEGPRNEKKYVNQINAQILDTGAGQRTDMWNKRTK
jgi:hypothetical protein